MNSGERWRAAIARMRTLPDFGERRHDRNRRQHELDTVLGEILRRLDDVAIRHLGRLQVLALEKCIEREFRHARRAGGIVLLGRGARGRNEVRDGLDVG